MLSSRNFLVKPGVLLCLRLDFAFDRYKWYKNELLERPELTTSQLSITTWKKMEKHKTLWQMPGLTKRPKEHEIKLEKLKLLFASYVFFASKCL